MSNSAAAASGPQESSIAPWLSVSRATEALAYYRAAFGAVVLSRLDDDDGRVAVAHLAIGSSDFWIQDDAANSPAPGGQQAVRMILTVGDPDAAFGRAVAAGATEIFAVTEGNGWRVGRIVDPFGHHWEVGKPLD